MSTQEVTIIVKNTPSALSTPSTPLPSTTLVSHAGRAQPIYKSNIPAPAPQQILEEDDYTEALSKIIERDFFPDIAKLKRQHEYLDALAMNDIQRIQAAARDLAGNDTPLTQRRLRTPAQTPKIGRTGLPNEAWTPARVDIGNATPTWKDDDPARPPSLSEDTPLLDTPTGKTLKKLRKSATETPEENTIDTSLSLDQFQARYTSEDNASFNEILEKMNMRKKEKYSWMYDQEKKSMRLIEQSNNPEMKLLRQSGEDSDSPQGSDDTSTLDKASMQVALTDSRAGTIPTWGYKAKNALMYFPEGLGTNLLDEMSRGSPKEIVHNNTNFPDRDLLVVNESAASKIDPAPYLRGEISNTPKVNGYGFVSSTPTPSMSQMENDPEMMTWGTIEDEPLLISSGIASTGPSPFKLPPTPRRELIAQKLSEKASKSFRDSSSLRAKVFSSPSTSALAKYHGALGGDTPTPRFSAYPYATESPTPYRRTPGSTSKSERMPSPSPRARAAMLSPAAQSLLNRAKSSRSRDADHQLRSSYGNSGRAGSSRGSVTPSPLTSRPK
ncbi:DiGeorge syndrome critical region protein 14 [Podila clonocystis]|nr:DiGeorge syndrome critical region protein 14 [Podila clonocystis]